MATPNDIRAGRAYVEIDGDNAKLKKKIVESEGVLKGLKKQFGEDSSLGLAGKTLMGAGALAGIGAIAVGLERATAKALELKEQFAGGKVNAAEMAMEIGKSVPILGSIVSAGENINELITGTKAKLEAVRQEDALQTNILATMRKITAETEKHRESTKRFIEEVLRKMGGVGRTGKDKAIYDNETFFADQIQKERDDKTGSLSSIDDAQKQIETLRQKIKDYQTKYSGLVQVPTSEYDSMKSNEAAVARLQKAIAQAKKAINDSDLRIAALVALRETIAKDIIYGDATEKDKAYRDALAAPKPAGVSLGGDLGLISSVGLLIRQGLRAAGNFKGQLDTGTSFGGFGSDASGAGRYQKLSQLDMTNDLLSKILSKVQPTFN